MGLSHDIISQFAKVVNPTKQQATESTLYGTVVQDGNSKFFRPDGSDQLIPISDSSVGSKGEITDQNGTVLVHGDRASVLIKNHAAVVNGNISSPAASTKDVVDEITRFDIAVGERIQAEAGYFDALISKEFQADTGKIGSLEAALITVAKLIGSEIIVDRIESDEINVSNLIAGKIDADIVVADKAIIEHLKSSTIDVLSLIADKAVIEDLIAKNVSLDSVEAKNAYLKYANIDFSNIGEAAITKLFSSSGIIKDLIVSEGKITGELIGVTIKGDLIEAGTLKADRLVVKGSDGKYYALSTDFSALPGVEPVEEDAIHGSVLVKKSIVAEHIAVDDLVAFGATIGRFHITDSKSYDKDNLIPFPYLINTYENGGDIYTVHDDGSISIYCGNQNGSSVNIAEGIHLRKGIYTFSGSAGDAILSIGRSSDSTFNHYIWGNIVETITLVEDVDDIFINISSDPYGSYGKTITIKPFLNEGDTPPNVKSVGSIYSDVKSSVDNTTRGIYMDTDGNFNVGDDANYVKYYSEEQHNNVYITKQVNGTVIAVNDVCVEPHIISGQLSSNNIDNFIDVALTRYGKNLFKPKTMTYRGGTKLTTANVNSDGSITLVGTCDQGFNYVVNENDNPILPAGIYTYSCSNKDLLTYIFVRRNGEQIFYDTTFELLDGDYIEFIQLRAPSNSFTINDTVTVQIEYGSTASNYEPYVEPQSIIATTEGAIVGITSASPSMTIFSNRNDVIIDIIYITNELLNHPEKKYKLDISADSIRLSSANKNIEEWFSDVAQSISEHVSNINVTTGGIALSVSEYEKKIDELTKGVETLRKDVELKVNEDNVKIEIQKAISNGVSTIKTSTGYEFGDDGLSIKKVDENDNLISPTVSFLDEQGLEVYEVFDDGDARELLIANKDGVDAKNLHATTYLIVGGHKENGELVNYSRFENFGNGRTACFWIGG